ncbi:MAG TPA: hypothetical protein VEB59_08015 [Gemmatimonadales bacterium]|nr:hypothetical protein [Gemmatimonadales bacterium]
MSQPSLAPDGLAMPAGTLPWTSRREARLRSEHAASYPGVRAGVWEPAAVLVDRIVAARLLRGGPLEIRERVLSDEHFEFRGGTGPSVRPRREDR